MTQPDPHDELAPSAVRGGAAGAAVGERAQACAPLAPSATRVRSRSISAPHRARTPRRPCATRGRSARRSRWLRPRGSCSSTRAPERRDTFAITPEHVSGVPRANANRARPVEPARTAPEPEPNQHPRPPHTRRRARRPRVAPLRSRVRARPASLAEEVAQLDRARGALARRRSAARARAGRRVRTSDARNAPARRGRAAAHRGAGAERKARARGRARAALRKRASGQPARRSRARAVPGRRTESKEVAE